MVQGDVWGHRKYLDECFSVEDSTLEEIRALAASGASADDVADQIHKKARIGSERIKYKMSIVTSIYLSLYRTIGASPTWDTTCSRPFRWAFPSPSELSAETPGMCRAAGHLPVQRDSKSPV